MKAKLLVIPILLSCCVSTKKYRLESQKLKALDNPEFVHFSRYRDCFLHKKYVILDSATLVHPLYIANAFHFDMLSFSPYTIGVTSRGDTATYIILNASKLIHNDKISLVPCASKDTINQDGLCFTVYKENYLNRIYCSGKSITFCNIKVD